MSAGTGAGTVEVPVLREYGPESHPHAFDQTDSEVQVMPGVRKNVSFVGEIVSNQYKI